MKERKIPLRMCVGCREMKPKRELLRVVKSPSGDVQIDRIGKAQGRGAYVCKNADCFKKARKSKALERALETAIAEAVFEQLMETIEGEAEREEGT